MIDHNKINLIKFMNPYEAVYVENHWRRARNI